MSVCAGGFLFVCFFTENSFSAINFLSCIFSLFKRRPPLPIAFIVPLLQYFLESCFCIGKIQLFIENWQTRIAGKD